MYTSGFLECKGEAAETYLTARGTKKSLTHRLKARRLEETLTRIAVNALNCKLHTSKLFLLLFYVII